MYSDVVEFRASKTVAHDAVLVVMRALMPVMRHDPDSKLVKGTRAYFTIRIKGQSEMRVCWSCLSAAQQL